MTTLKQAILKSAMRRPIHFPLITPAQADDYRKLLVEHISKPFPNGVVIDHRGGVEWLLYNANGTLLHTNRNLNGLLNWAMYGR